LRINNSDDEVVRILNPFLIDPCGAAYHALCVDGHRELAQQEKRMTLAVEKTFAVEGIRIPDSSLAREITELVRDTWSALLFHHSSRVHYCGALAGKRRALKFNRELLYAARCFTTWAFCGVSPRNRR
jgi:hypothetical protein